MRFVYDRNRANSSKGQLRRALACKSRYTFGCVFVISVDAMRSCISLVIGYNSCRSWIDFRECKTYEKTSENSDPEINGRDRAARLAQMVEIAWYMGRDIIG